MTTNEETNYDEMSEEELDKLLSTEEGGGLETSEESEQVEVEVGQTSSDSDNTDVQKEVDTKEGETKDLEEQKQDNTTGVLDGDNIPEHYRGKTVNDLYEMQVNANRKISQQANENYQVIQQLKQVQAQLAKYQQNELKKNEDDLLSQYDSKDIEAIKHIIKSQFEESQKKQNEENSRILESAKRENDQVWENLETYNPQLFYQIKDEALSVMSKDMENTYHRNGWLKGFISEKAKTLTEQGQTRSENKSDLKRRAVTVTSSGSSMAVNSSPKKSVENMSLSELDEYMKRNNL
jgi:hypothetical protein